MLPPPAPISKVWIEWIFSGSPLPRLNRSRCATSSSEASMGAPPGTSVSLAVVPPMSNDSTSGTPAIRPYSAAASTPAAGPDSMIRTGIAAADAAGTRPPLEVIR